MSTSKLWFFRPQIFLFTALVIFLPGFAHTLAQITAPAPSQAQVIAQSVETVSGGSMKWYIQEEVAPPDGQPRYEASNEFVYAESGQVVVTDPSGKMNLLSGGQAMYAGQDNQVGAYGDSQEELLIVSLVSASTPDGGITAHPFDVEAGTYNLQLTRGIMNAGDRDTFIPSTNYPFLIVVTSGSVSLNEPGSTEVEVFPAGNVGEWTGVNEIVSDEASSYIIVSIGEKVQVPAPAARVPVSMGTVQIMFYDCPQTVLGSKNPNECTPITVPVQATLTSANGSVTRTTGIDATEQPDHWWVFKNMAPGNWLFKWVIGDGSPDPQIVISGDALLEGTQWQVVAKSGATTTAYVMIVPHADQGIELNTLTVYFLECPSGWMADDSFTDCFAAETPPNLELTDVMGAGIILSTDWDAVSTATGVYVFDQIPSQTYFISIASNDYWTWEKTHLLGSAYSDGLDWYVDVPSDDTPVEIFVVLGHIGDASNVPDSGTTLTGTGQVLITQMECLDMEGSGCVGAESPWEVYLFNDSTGDMYVLTREATMVGEGQWLMFVPAGSYTVQLPNDAGWYVEYTGWIEVFDQTESYVNVTGYP